MTMENTENSNNTDTDTIVVKDDNGNFEEESVCSVIPVTEDKETHITNPADVKDDAKDEGTGILSVENVEAPSLQIQVAVKTSKDVVNNDFCIEGVINTQASCNDKCLPSRVKVVNKGDEDNWSIGGSKWYNFSRIF